VLLVIILLRTKAIGILLIFPGIAMPIFRGFSVQPEKKVNKKENKWAGWPICRGIAIIARVIWRFFSYLYSENSI